MTQHDLSNYISMHHGPLTLDLEAEEVSRDGAFKQFLKQYDTLVLRIAVPPLAIWGLLYSLTEFVM